MACAYAYSINCCSTDPSPCITEWIYPIDENGYQDDPEEINQHLSLDKNGLEFTHDLYDSPDYRQEQAWFYFAYDVRR
jgi:hypothetical protein